MQLYLWEIRQLTPPRLQQRLLQGGLEQPGEAWPKTVKCDVMVDLALLAC
jgi:hypothetical protein